MAKKTLSVQLMESQTIIDDLNKKLINAESVKNMYMKEAQEAKTELEQLHQMIDAFPGSMPREGEGANSWERIKRNAVTRLGAWLATRCEK